eukprot:72879_1
MVSIFHQFILRYISILAFAWGRGYFYLFIFWELTICDTSDVQHDGKGVHDVPRCYLYHHVAGRKLKKMAKNIGSKNRLAELFSKHDKDRDRYLDVENFQSEKVLIMSSSSSSSLVWRKRGAYLK